MQREQCRQHQVPGPIVVDPSKFVLPKLPRDWHPQEKAAPDPPLSPAAHGCLSCVPQSGLPAAAGKTASVLLPPLSASGLHSHAREDEGVRKPAGDCCKAEVCSLMHFMGQTTPRRILVCRTFWVLQNTIFLSTHLCPSAAALWPSLCACELHPLPALCALAS